MADRHAALRGQSLIIGFVLLVTNLVVHRLFGWAVSGAVQAWIQDLPFIVELALILLVADLVQHHSQDREAIDRNYAAHFAFLDYLFGTAVRADRAWPHAYGVVGDYVPEGFIRQQLFPFRGRRAVADPAGPVGQSPISA